MAYDPKKGYDPDKDYSTALSNPNLSAAERAQLTSERQAKINGVYGGVEPGYNNSGKTFSQTYGADGSGVKSTLDRMSDSDLAARSAQNSQKWYGSDSATQKALHAENEYINTLRDARNGTTTTYNSGTGEWTTRQRDTSWYDPAVYGAGSNRAADAFNGLSRNAETGQVYAPTGVNMTGYAMRDWANDRTNIVAGALGSTSMAEFSTFMDGYERQAKAQGFDISGNDPNHPSREQIFQQWWSERGQYIPNSFKAWDGSDGVGFYGVDENGDYGYYADAARTIKLENGNWGKNPNSGGGSRVTTARGDVGYRQSAAGTAVPDYAAYSYGGGYGTYGGASGGYSAGNYSAYDNDMVAELRSLYRGQDSAYAQALAEQKAAQEDAVRRATEKLNAQKESTNSSYAALFRQLYIDKMNARKNIEQRMAAQGVTGGAAESTLLGLETDYEDALRQGEQGRIGTIGDLDHAITDAELSGDMASAQAAADMAREQTDNYASVLRKLIDRYDTISARQEAYAREDAQLAQKYAYQRERDAIADARYNEEAARAERTRQEAALREAAEAERSYAYKAAESDRSYAYKTATQLISSGILPDSDLLAAAGIGEGAARSMVDAVLAERDEQERKAAEKPKLTVAQVNAAIKAGRVTPEVRVAYQYWYGVPYNG